VLTLEKRKTVISDYRLHEKDTGSPEVQIALLSARIEYLTEKIIIHAADCSSWSVREEGFSITLKIMT
jgi:small subunit ribosomal protein S15